MYLSTSTSTEDFPEMYLSTFQVLYKLYLSTDVLKYKVLLPGSDGYAVSVCSTLTHGSEAWMLTPRALATLNGFNSRQLHRITGRSYREWATKPSYDLLTAVRTRRHQWLGHILRMPADHLVRHAVLALGQQTGPAYQPNSLLMNTPLSLTELVMPAADRRG